MYFGTTQPAWQLHGPETQQAQSFPHSSELSERPIHGAPRFGMNRVISTGSHARPMGVKTTRDLVGPRAGVLVRVAQPRTLPRAEAELRVTLPLFILQGVGPGPRSCLPRLLVLRPGTDANPVGAQRALERVSPRAGTWPGALRGARPA